MVRGVSSQACSCDAKDVSSLQLRLSINLLILVWTGLRAIAHGDPPPTGVYVDRTPGGDCGHWSLDGTFAAGNQRGSWGGPTDAVPVEHEAAWAGIYRVCADERSFAARSDRSAGPSQPRANSSQWMECPVSDPSVHGGSKTAWTCSTLSCPTTTRRTRPRGGGDDGVSVSIGYQLGASPAGERISEHQLRGQSRRLVCLRRFLSDGQCLGTQLQANR